MAVIGTRIIGEFGPLVTLRIAFAASLSFLEPMNDLSRAAEPGALLGIGPVVPYWVSLAVTDWCVKLAIAVLGLLPFRLIVTRKLALVA